MLQSMNLCVYMGLYSVEETESEAFYQLHCSWLDGVEQHDFWKEFTQNKHSTYAPSHSKASFIKDNVYKAVQWQLANAICSSLKSKRVVGFA